MKVDIGHFKLEVDVDRTREFYKTWHPITQDCDCASCKNYIKAIEVIPENVKHFFEKLGIDMYKEAEVMIPLKVEDGKLMYSVFYHLVGKIMSCENPKNSVEISDGFSVWFSNGCDLIPEQFPKPVVQMFLYAKLPWLLDEECNY